MNRSYFVDSVVEQFSKGYGWQIFCFEDDDCIWDQLFTSKEKAEEFGKDYVNGVFSNGFFGGSNG